MIGPITSEQEALRRFFKYRVPASDDECVSEQMTATPGMFYHGSPYVNITEFRTRFERGDGFTTEGISFTQVPNYAATAGVKRWGFGGRIYRAELITQNPYFVTHEVAGISIGQREIETTLSQQLRAEGYDAIVMLHLEGTIYELIVLDENVVRVRDEDIGPLKQWEKEGVSAADSPPPIFYQKEGSGPPSYAPGCLHLHGSRVPSCRPVVVEDARNPIYCVRDAWPRFDFDLLRYRGVDCLVDPRDGGALVIDPDKIVPLNRNTLRLLRSMSRRHGRTQREHFFAADCVR